MKPQRKYFIHNQPTQTLVSLKFYADTSAFGLSNLQPVQVYDASMSYDFFFQERGKRHYELTSASLSNLTSASLLTSINRAIWFDISPLASREASGSWSLTFNNKST